MCTKTRRCPGSKTLGARTKHNQRRRVNNQVRRQVRVWAEENELEIPGDAQRDIRVLREWAQRHGASTETVSAVDPRLCSAHAEGGGAGAAGGVVLSESDEAWVAPFRERFNAVLTKQNEGISEQERALMTAPVVSVEGIYGGGVNNTYRVEFEGGAAGYFKPFSELDDECGEMFGQLEGEQPIFEAAAWQFAKEMGPEYAKLVAPCALREVNGQWGSVSMEVPGETCQSSGYGYSDFDPEDVRRMALFDVVIGQQDRHDDNFMVSDDLEIHGIDHGFTFARPGDYINASNLRYYRAGTDPDLSAEEIQLLHRISESEDCLGMEAIVGKERAEAVRNRAAYLIEEGFIQSH